MNRRDIRLLQKIKGSPAVTITLPAHRATPDNQQDPIRVKDLVKQAKDCLRGEYDQSEVEPLLLQLEKLAESIDYRFTQDGLAMFVNRDLARAVHLPFSLDERVVVGESFHTRDLVYAMNRAPRYWALVLSEKPTRLLEGTRDNLLEIRAGGFPLTQDITGGTQPLPAGVGIRRSAIRDERLRQFFRQVDAALKPYITEDPLPLAVVGVERHLAFFDEVTGFKDAIVATLTDSHDQTSLDDLSGLVWPLVKAGLANQRLDVLADFKKAIGEHKFAAGVEEVWRLAKEGRGRLLVVEEDFHLPARLDGAEERLQAEQDPSVPGVTVDAVDEILETVLSKQGRVVFVDNDRLEAHQHIALILR